MTALAGRPPGWGATLQAALGQWRSVAFWLALSTLAVFLGLLCVLLPWVLVLGLAAAVCYAALLWSSPPAAVGVYFLALLLSPDFKLSDVLTACTLACLGVALLLDRQRLKFPRRAWHVYAFFMGMVLLSALLALAYFGNSLAYVYRDGRAFMYWVWLPILFWMCNRSADAPARLSRLLIGMAVAVSVLALVQYFFGLQLVREGRVGALETGGVVDADLTRVQMPGFTFVLVALVWAMSKLMRGGRALWWVLPSVLLFAAAIYVNFGRALWFWTFVAVALSGLLMGLRRSLSLAGLLCAVGLVVGTSLFVFKPAVIDNMVHRMVSVIDEGGSGSSFGWRKLENDAALIQIERSPLVGMGLGAEYRRWMAEVRNFTEHTRYVHNSYVFMALKLGVPALLALMVLIMRPWWIMFRGRAQASVRQNDMLVALLASWLPLLAISTTQPELVNPHTIFLYCIMLALFLTAIHGRDAQARLLKQAASTQP